MKLKKYLSVFSISWQSGFVYRLNFIMWRLRLFVGTIALYFLWLAILKDNTQIFGYSQSELLTYVLGASIIRSLVFSSRSITAQAEIASGDLNNYLIKPVGYFPYWLSRDLADKLLNLIFAALELTIIFLLLKPPFIFQTNLIQLLLFMAAAILATFMYFYFSFLVSMSTFWLPERNGWPQRFFVFTLLEFFSGGLFPLDILPPHLFAFAKHLPTAYMLHTPLQIYLGRLSFTESLTSLSIMTLWLVIFIKVTQYVFKRGLKIYGAYGR